MMHQLIVVVNWMNMRQQPCIRPIVWGKRQEPTESGQKIHLSVVNGYTLIQQTCWSNFNECKDLPQVVENYCRRYECYRSAVRQTSFTRRERTETTAKHREYACPVRHWNGRMMRLPRNSVKSRRTGIPVPGSR